MECDERLGRPADRDQSSIGTSVACRPRNLILFACQKLKIYTELISIDWILFLYYVSMHEQVGTEFFDADAAFTGLLDEGIPSLRNGSDRPTEVASF